MTNTHAAIVADLVKALERLCDAIADTELHGDGAHYDNCMICEAHASARVALARAKLLDLDRAEVRNTIFGEDGKRVFSSVLCIPLRPTPGDGNV